MNDVNRCLKQIPVENALNIWNVWIRYSLFWIACQNIVQYVQCAYQKHHLSCFRKNSLWTLHSEHCIDIHWRKRNRCSIQTRFSIKMIRWPEFRCWTETTIVCILSMSERAQAKNPKQKSRWLQHGVLVNAYFPFSMVKSKNISSFFFFY